MSVLEEAATTEKNDDYEYQYDYIDDKEKNLMLVANYVATEHKIKFKLKDLYLPAQMEEELEVEEGVGLASAMGAEAEAFRDEMIG